MVHPPPPEQRWVSPYPPALDSWVAMDRPDAERYIVSGIREVHVQGERWVGRLPEPVANKAGEVTLKVAANDEPFGAFTYTEAGTYEIKKPVAARSLPWDRNTEISLEIEPSRDANWKPFELGFLIKSVGFRP